MQAPRRRRKVSSFVGDYRDLPDKIDGTVWVEHPRRFDRAQRHVAEPAVVGGVQEEEGSGLEPPQLI